MQTAGNKLCERFGADYLAQKTIERIVKFRTEKGGIKDGVALPGRRERKAQQEIERERAKLEKESSTV